MLKRKIYNLYRLFILLSCVLTLTQCMYNFLPNKMPKEGPSVVVQKYAVAMKEYDMLTMQKYLSSDANKTNSAAAGLVGDLVGGLTGFNLNMDNLLTLAGPLMQLNKAMGMSGPFDTLTMKSIESEDIDYDYQTATVLVLYEYDLSIYKDEFLDSDTTPDVLSYRVKYHLIVENDEWKINKEENLDPEKFMNLLQSLISE